ncbi:MAG: hypothetical protein LBD52_01020 [Prevotellaceae bacterium]|jgi:hypothetical protein|nr:hypothetical protein [Prevotellaceae bacterium]
MKKYLLIGLLLTPFSACAQQDAYFEGFCKAFDTFRSFFNTYRASPELSSDGGFHSFSGLTQQYHTLLKVFDEASFKYRRDAFFDAIFRPEYLNVLEEVELLLEADAPLRSLKDMVRTMVRIEREGFPRSDIEVEESIRLLRFAKVYRPEFFESTLEGMLLKKQITGLEAYIFRKYFDKVIATFKTAPATDSLRAQVRNVMELAESSSCVPCRDSLSTVLLDFYYRMNDF